MKSIPSVNYFLHKNFSSKNLSSTGNINITIDIVVSHYKSPLSWLTDMKKLLVNKKVRFFIYNKGKELPNLSKVKLEFPKAEFKIINLDNVGTCDHTYLYHIINNYDDLADATYFLTDTSDLFHKRGALDTIIETDINSEYIFPTILNIPSYNFTLDNYTPAGLRTGLNTIKLSQSKIRPYGKWFEEMTNVPYFGLTSYSGLFMANRSRIRRRDLEFYKKIIIQMDDVYCEVAHYMERMWYWVMAGDLVNKKELAVLAIVKNEGKVINEWLDHYRWQGVEHFYMIDNNSTDDTREILLNQPDVSYYYCPIPHSQINYYNQVFNIIKNDCEWLIVCDADEYIYNRNKGQKITDYLRNVTQNAISLDWKMFTSNGYITQPPSIRKYFTRRRKRLFQSDKNSKMIVRASSTSYLYVHAHKYEGLPIVNPPELALNHYAIMSLEYFKEVKMNRGCVMSKSNDKLRDMKYFMKYDIGDSDDYELRNLVMKYEKSSLSIEVLP